MSIHLFNAIIKLICQNMVKKNFQAFLSKIAPPVQKAHPFALHPGPEDPLRSCAPWAFLINGFKILYVIFSKRVRFWMKEMKQNGTK